MKGFLKLGPTREDMELWARSRGQRPMVTSFTDGTKVQAEQVLVASHSGASVAQEGMKGSAVESLKEGTDILTDGLRATRSTDRWLRS